MIKLNKTEKMLVVWAIEERIDSLEQYGQEYIEEIVEYKKLVEKFRK